MAVCLTKSKYALSWPLQGLTQGPCRRLLKTALKASFADCLTSLWHLNPTDIQLLSSLKMLTRQYPALKKRRRKGARLQWARKSGISLTTFRIISYRYMPFGEKRVTCTVVSSSSPSEQILWTQCSWHRMGEWLEATTAMACLPCSPTQVCISTRVQLLRKGSIRAKNVKVMVLGFKTGKSQKANPFSYL